MCSIVPILEVMSHITIISHLSNIETVTRSNFNKCNRYVQFPEGLMDLDMFLLEDKLVVPTSENTQGVETKLKKRERLNGLS